MRFEERCSAKSWKSCFSIDRHVSRSDRLFSWRAWFHSEFFNCDFISIARSLFQRTFYFVIFTTTFEAKIVKRHKHRATDMIHSWQFSLILTFLRLSYSLKFRPIAILVSSVYVTWVYRTFYSQYSLQLPKELTYKCKRYYDNCSELRQNRPNVFCGFVASILFLVAVIGHLVSGTSIMCGNVATLLTKQTCSKLLSFSQLVLLLLSSLLPNTKSKSSKKSVSFEIDFLVLVCFRIKINCGVWLLRHESADNQRLVDTYILTSV